MHVGSELRRARFRKGLTRERLSETTKISAARLDAIERQRIEELPPLVYLRGYLRAFAREVDLDPDDVVARYIAQFANDSVARESKHAPPPGASSSSSQRAEVVTPPTPPLPASQPLASIPRALDQFETEHERVADAGWTPAAQPGLQAEPRRQPEPKPEAKPEIAQESAPETKPETVAEAKATPAKGAEDPPPWVYDVPEFMRADNDEAVAHDMAPARPAATEPAMDDERLRGRGSNDPRTPSRSLRLPILLAVIAAITIVFMLIQLSEPIGVGRGAIAGEGDMPSGADAPPGEGAGDRGQVAGESANAVERSDAVVPADVRLDQEVTERAATGNVPEPALAEEGARAAGRSAPRSARPPPSRVSPPRASTSTARAKSAPRAPPPPARSPAASSARPNVRRPAASTVRNLSGWWSVTNQVDASSLSTFRGLRLGYQLQLEQNGARVTGRGVKISENGRELPESRQTPITVSGSIEGDRLQLSFRERGARRTSGGTFTMRFNSEGALQGTFQSDAARSSGRSRAQRVR